MNHNPTTSPLRSTDAALKSAPVLDYRSPDFLPDHSVTARLHNHNLAFAASRRHLETSLAVAMSASISSPSANPDVPPLSPDDLQASDADSSLDSKLDDCGVPGSDCPSPSGPGFVIASPEPNEPSNHQHDSHAYEPVEFDFSITVPGGKTCGQAKTSFRDKLTADYMEECEFDFKELLRRERNRAAAQRSNIKKKQQKEARKTELAWLQGLERQLRARELDLRRQNKCLRTLVYLSGQRLPLIPMDGFQEIRCFPGAGLNLAQLPQDKP